MGLVTWEASCIRLVQGKAGLPLLRKELLVVVTLFQAGRGFQLHPPCFSPTPPLYLLCVRGCRAWGMVPSVFLAAMWQPRMEKGQWVLSGSR